MVLLFKLFTATPKKSTALPTFVRFLQGLLALGIIAGIVLLIVLTRFAIAYLFASAFAFIATGWCVLCLAITWKRLIKTVGLWDCPRDRSDVRCRNGGRHLCAYCVLLVVPLCINLPVPYPVQPSI